MIVFLDRDGVILKPIEKEGKGYAISEVTEIEYYPDVKSSFIELKTIAEFIFVITNQPDLHTGQLTIENLREIHSQILTDLPITEIFFCPHISTHYCNCRKPKTGLFHSARDRWKITNSDFWMVGDRDSDIQAGQKFGCKTIFIDRGWEGEVGLEADYKVESLQGAVEIIIHG